MREPRRKRDAPELVVQIKRLVPDRRCLKRAESTPTRVALGRTGVRAKAAIPAGVQKKFRRLERTAGANSIRLRLALRQPGLAQAFDDAVPLCGEGRIVR